MARIRKSIIFYGWVQGVGFRWRARTAADQYGVTGWIRNLPDGSVEAEFEAEESAIDNVIIFIEKSSYIKIERMSVKSIPLKNDHIFECLY